MAGVEYYGLGTETWQSEAVDYPSDQEAHPLRERCDDYGDAPSIRRGSAGVRASEGASQAADTRGRAGGHSHRRVRVSLPIQELYVRGERWSVHQGVVVA